MTGTATATSTATTRTTPAQRPPIVRSHYVDSPSLKEVASGSATIQRGHRGEDVLAMQRALNAAGANPPLAEDGLFGPKTEAALKSFQSRNNITNNGVLGTDTMRALLPDLATLGDGYAPANGPAPRAPQQGAQRPAGAVRARDLQQEEEALRRPRGPSPTAETGQTGPTTGPTPVAPSPPPSGPADARLAQIQQNAVGSAQRELAAGVREDHSIGNNRGARVDQYARNARMPEGGEWCGYFTQFNYSQAAQEAGGDFRGSLHSFQKARSFFNYRDYTNASRSRNQELDTLRSQHEQQGSSRRFMVLEGSTGQDWAARNNRPAEVYQPNNLPIRPGDTILFNFGHVGMVEGYDPATGRLTTVEGNVGNRVQRKTYDLNDPRVRARIEGFGRPAAGDFEAR
jgi:peptidoglycan hydrolase-like protein with peptidoglycan-binding domain